MLYLINLDIGTEYIPIEVKNDYIFTCTLDNYLNCDFLQLAML